MNKKMENKKKMHTSLWTDRERERERKRAKERKRRKMMKRKQIESIQMNELLHESMVAFKRITPINKLSSQIKCVTNELNRKNHENQPSVLITRDQLAVQCSSKMTTVSINYSLNDTNTWAAQSFSRFSPCN